MAEIDGEVVSEMTVVLENSKRVSEAGWSRERKSCTRGLSWSYRELWS